MPLGEGRGGKMRGRAADEGGRYYGRASELYGLPHVCRINLPRPRPDRPPRDCTGTVSRLSFDTDDHDDHDDHDRLSHDPRRLTDLTARIV